MRRDVRRSANQILYARAFRGLTVLEDATTDLMLIAVSPRNPVPSHFYVCPADAQRKQWTKQVVQPLIRDSLFSAKKISETVQPGSTTRPPSRLCAICDSAARSPSKMPKRKRHAPNNAPKNQRVLASLGILGVAGVTTVQRLTKALRLSRARWHLSDKKRVLERIRP